MIDTNFMVSDATLDAMYRAGAALSGGHLRGLRVVADHVANSAIAVQNPTKALERIATALEKMPQRDERPFHG
jgi:hypothetical protein